MNARCGAHPPLSIPALPFQIYSTLHPPAAALRLDTAHNSSSPVRSSLSPAVSNFIPPCYQPQFYSPHLAPASNQCATLPILLFSCDSLHSLIQRGKSYG